MKCARRMGAMCAAVALLAAAGSALGQGTATLPDTAEVTVTGRSALRGEVARDEALRDAMRNAVEQAAGVFIAAQSETQNYQLVKDVIFSRARGFVQKYTILSEKRDDDGVYVVEIRAVVKTKAVADSWLDYRAILVEKGMPRLMVVVAETVDGTAGDANTAQTRIENALLKDGFSLVNKEQVKDNDARDLKAAALADDLAKVAAISTRYKADIVVIGKSRAVLTRRRPIYGVMNYLYNADAEVRAIRTANAKVLFSDSGHASRGDRNQTEAARQALIQVGLFIGKALKLRLVTVWVTEMSKQVGTDYDLEVTGIKFAQIAVLIKEMKANAKLVTTCNLKDFREGVAFLVVGSTTSTTNLAIWMSGLKAVPLEVTQVNPGSIKAKVKAEE